MATMVLVLLALLLALSLVLSVRPVQKAPVLVPIERRVRRIRRDDR